MSQFINTKTPSFFPDVTEADEYGILAVGGEIEPGLLFNAYCNGIFPWPHPQIDGIPWFAPEKRGILYFRDFRGRARIKRYIRSQKFEFKFNTKFISVMRECARKVNREIKETWITDEMINGYSKLHKLGFAHSLEVYKDSKLVGGIYGVSIGKMFAAESMFFRESNASKAALMVLIDFLAQQGVKWIDCQQLTNHLKSLGGVEVTRERFMNILYESIHQNNILFPTGNLTI